jgi:hypothetical protein
VVATWSDPRHVILTAPRVPYDANLLSAIGAFRRAFHRLQKMPSWSEVRGGLYGFHVEPKPDGWHLHLHVLVNGWVEARGGSLHREWSCACGRTAVAKVLKVSKTSFDQVAYTADLSPKALQTLQDHATTAQVQGWVQLLEGGSHFFETFGDVRKVKQPKESRTCPVCGEELKNRGAGSLFCQLLASGAGVPAWSGWKWYADSMVVLNPDSS